MFTSVNVFTIPFSFYATQITNLFLLQGSQPITIRGWDFSQSRKLYTPRWSSSVETLLHFSCMELDNSKHILANKLMNKLDITNFLKFDKWCMYVGHPLTHYRSFIARRHLNCVFSLRTKALKQACSKVANLNHILPNELTNRLDITTY